MISIKNIKLKKLLFGKRYKYWNYKIFDKMLTHLDYVFYVKKNSNKKNPVFILIFISIVLTTYQGQTDNLKYRYIRHRTFEPLKIYYSISKHLLFLNTKIFFCGSLFHKYKKIWNFTKFLFKNDINKTNLLILTKKINILPACHYFRLFIH